MAQFPDSPFLTADFSQPGSGIDFLGLRLVNLGILGDHLLPGLNNQTRDAGSYCIGAWIPWKFANLWTKGEFSKSNYDHFRQYIEIIFSHQMHDGSQGSKSFGMPKNRIGIGQQLKFPARPRFEEAERTEATSIYAAPLYGPSLKYLGLLMPDSAAAIDGTSTGIPLAQNDVDTLTILTELDKLISSSIFFKDLKISPTHKIELTEADDLGKSGLCASVFLTFSDHAKAAFIRKLLPIDKTSNGWARTLTSKLLVETLKVTGPADLWDIRNIWYTGLLANGKEIKFGEELDKHQKLWAAFMARQYQRQFLERFLRFFETSLINNCRSIQEIAAHAISQAEEEGLKLSTLSELIGSEGQFLGVGLDLGQVSKKWNSDVHFEHKSFDDILEVEGDINQKDAVIALLAMTRWYIRTNGWKQNKEIEPIMQYGGSSRVGISWFCNWIEKRKELPIQNFLEELFQEIIFTQHIRIALSRFDGQAQKVRFILDDQGIVPTKAAKKDMGNREIPWMADRLYAFVDLLCDVDVLKRDGDLVKLNEENKIR